MEIDTNQDTAFLTEVEHQTIFQGTQETAGHQVFRQVLQEEAELILLRQKQEIQEQQQRQRQRELQTAMPNRQNPIEIRQVHETQL